MGNNIPRFVLSVASLSYLLLSSDVQFLPISGLVGSNVKTGVDKSLCSWWNGPCLFEALDAVEVPPRDPKGSFRYCLTSNDLVDYFLSFLIIVAQSIIGAQSS